MPQLFNAQNAYTYWVNDYRPNGPARQVGDQRNPLEGRNDEKTIQKARASKLQAINYRWLQSFYDNRAGINTCPNCGCRRPPGWANGLEFTAENLAYERDVGMWYGTLQRSALIDTQGTIVGSAPPGLPPGANQRRSHDFLRRIFAILLYASSRNKLLFKRENEWQRWGDYRVPIASALSHGGRVLIELTNDENEYRHLRDWLFYNVPNLRKRIGTHGVEPLQAPEPIGANPIVHRRLQEIKTGPTKTRLGRALRGQRPKLRNVVELGINIGLGGYNQYNFISGKRIKLDGTHGHIYIYQAHPESRTHYGQREGVPGCIMIGCEGSAPIDCYEGGPDTKYPGTKFTGWAYDQTGHAHKLGGAGRFSPTGGLKWKEKEWHSSGPNISCDGMYVQLSSADMTHLMTGPFNAMHIHGATTWNDTLVGYNRLP